ncbi:sensor domain-containing diguanylate cyclase [Bisbaumannia pacifica]|uniref:sensor domain-containing diguanylate cyclase n=1 Tax=Bisbaumannia pacifica TaxID=77098 RepID=UPI00307ABD0E
MLKRFSTGVSQWRLRTLQGRLLVGLVVTWLVIIGLLLGVAWGIGQTMVGSTHLTQLGYQAEMLSRGLQERLEQRFNALTYFVERLGEEEGALLLAETPSLLAHFEGVVVTDAGGRVIADLPEVPGRVGLETASREYFQLMRHSPWPHVSRPFLGRASEQPLVMLLVPRFTADGEFNGMVGGLLNLAHGRFFRSLASLAFQHQGHVAIVTADGSRVFVPGPLEAYVERLQRQTPRDYRLALDGWEGETRHGLGDESVLVAYRQVRVADWVVAMVMPRRAVLAPLEAFLEQLWWTWLVAVVLMLVVTRWWVGRQLTPLHRLEGQIAEITVGDRQQLALSTDLRELTQVSDAFNLLEQERREALGRLHDREAFLNAVLGSTPTGVFIADLEGELVYLNPALRRLVGLDSPAAANALWQRIHPEDLEDTRDLWRHALRQGSDFLRQLRLLDGQGEVLWGEVHASLVREGDQALGLVGTVKDITERRQQEALQRWEAEHDPLTGLLNRRGFERRLEEAFADFTKTGTPSAVILFDLDHFKPINDEGGHALGDELLRRVAQVVAWEVRRSDHLARQGGDEFGLLLPSCTLKQAHAIAESVREVIAQVSVTTTDKEYFVTASIGLTGFRDGDASVEASLARADAASYAAKGQGRNAVVIDAGEASPGIGEEAIDALFE